MCYVYLLYPNKPIACVFKIPMLWFGCDSLFRLVYLFDWVNVIVHKVCFFLWSLQLKFANVLFYFVNSTRVHLDPISLLASYVWATKAQTFTPESASLAIEKMNRSWSLDEFEIGQSKFKSWRSWAKKPPSSYFILFILYFVILGPKPLWLCFFSLLLSRLI